MSAYLVDNKCINRILNGLLIDSMFSMSFELDIKEAMGLDVRDHENKEKGIEALGRAMVLMNIDAVNQRYGESEDSTNALKEHNSKAYAFHFISTDRMQTLKSLQCWLYQCSEGNITTRKLYKVMTNLKHSLCSDLVRSIPRYDSCEWG